MGQFISKVLHPFSPINDNLKYNKIQIRLSVLLGVHNPEMIISN